MPHAHCSFSWISVLRAFPSYSATSLMKMACRVTGRYGVHAIKMRKVPGTGFDPVTSECLRFGALVFPYESGALPDMPRGHENFMTARKQSQIRMKRITATVSGRIQNVGYRARVVSIAKEFGVTGSVRNLSDGGVRITAEGEEEVLKGFLAAIKIRNTLINVEAVGVEQSDATGDYADFYKLVGKGETDERLDKASDYLKKIIVVMENGFGAVRDEMKTGFSEVKGEISEMRDEMKTGFSEVKGEISGVKEEVSEMRNEMKTGFETLGSKEDRTAEELRYMRGDLTKYMEWKFEKVSNELEAKFAPEFDEIKRALRAHGIMDEPEQSGVGDEN